MAGSVSQPLFSAPDARAYFLLLAQKKVAKEKSTPGSAPLRGSLRYSADRASRMNSPAAQTMRADCPRPACVAQRPSRGPEKRLGSTGEPKFSLLRSTPKKGQKSNSFLHPLSPGGFTGPLERCRATQGLAEKGRGLFEGRSPEFRSPRQHRVAQGTRVAGTDPGSPFLCLLSFGEAKESNAAAQRRKPCLKKQSAVSNRAPSTPPEFGPYQVFPSNAPITCVP